MGRIVGYFITAIGLILLAAGLINEIRTFIETSLGVKFEQIDDISLIITGAVIIAIGIFLVMRSPMRRKSSSREVPIYHGKDIVGYRRH